MHVGEAGLVVTSPAPRTAWEAAVAADPDCLVSQSPAWRDAVFADHAYADASRSYEFGAGRQVLLPLARRRILPGLPVLASWPPGWEVAGPICPDGRISESQAAAILADVAGLGALSAEIRLRPGADEHWLAAATPPWRVERRSCYVLDLQGGFGVVWSSRFRSSARRAVRKAERSPIEVEVGRSEQLLDAFYGLYQQSIRRWAAQQHEPAWLARLQLTRELTRARLQQVAEHFGDSCTVWLARLGGQPAAATIVLEAGRYAKYWRGAMDKELAGPVRASNLLHRLAIERACDRGYRWYDMGFGDEPQLVAFKTTLGALALDTYSLRRERLPIRSARLSAERLVKQLIGFRKPA